MLYFRVRPLAVIGLSLIACVKPAIADCGPNSTIGEYYINNHGQRVWCSSGGSADIVHFLLDIISGLYGIAHTIGGVTTMIGSIVAVAVGVHLTGSEAVRVRTYRNHHLVSDEIRGGIEAWTNSGFGRLVGNLLKIAGIVMLLFGAAAWRGDMG